MAPLSLLDILSNEYLLLATTPYLLPKELLSLALASRSYYGLITHSRSVWRHLDLSLSARRATVPALDFLEHPASPFVNESKVERLLNKPFVLRDVKTLVLDGLPITIEFLSGLLTGSRYRLQVLSIRECNQVNEFQLMQLLQYLLRNTRDKEELSLKGVYYFGDADAPIGKAAGYAAAAASRQPKKGKFIPSDRLTNGWVGMLQACAGAIAFDTRLCTGPRHLDGAKDHVSPRIASVRLEGGCASCGSCPERREHREHELQRVLIPPVPITTSDIKVACRSNGAERDVLRCQSCVQDKWCQQCGKWWCEDCASAMQSQKVTRHAISDSPRMGRNTFNHCGCGDTETGRRRLLRVRPIVWRLLR